MASTAHFQNLGTGLQGAVIDAHDPIAINTLSRQEETEQEKVDEKKYGYTSENVDAADSDIMSLKQTEAIAFEMVSLLSGARHQTNTEYRPLLAWPVLSFPFFFLHL